ncbi:MAG TPA: tetratricopeptide repeat protein [Polyangiales bacterium]
MKTCWLAIGLLFALCWPDAEPLAHADRPHGSWKAAKAPAPTTTPSARAWQASYAAEAAGKFDDALTAMTQLPTPQRDTYLANYRRGWLLYRTGHYAEAVTAYHTAADLAPSSIEARVAMLVPLMALTKWDEVATAAQDVLKRDPNNYLALQRLAFAKFSTQHFPDAESVYRRLIQLYPSDIEMRSSLGWATLRMGKQKEAVALFSEVLDVNPNHVSAVAGFREASKRKPQAKL